MRPNRNASCLCVLQGGGVAAVPHTAAAVHAHALVVVEVQEGAKAQVSCMRLIALAVLTLLVPS